MKTGKFLYLTLLLGHCLQARVFVKGAQQAATTFDFPVGCSAYNSYHQVAWLGAAEKTQGDDAEYAVSCARHMTIEGSVQGGEALPIISPRAMKKTHLFTNSVRRPVEFDVDNPVYGAACKLLVLHTTLPVVVLKDRPNSLYLLSDQFIDEKTMEREGLTVVSSFSFNPNEIIHHVVSHANSLYVFHAQGEFGADETSRVTVIGVEPDRLKVDDREQPFVFHRMQMMASCQIQKNNRVLMGDNIVPLAALGLPIKTTEHDGKLFAAFSVTADTSGFASSLVRMGIRRKEKKKEQESATIIQQDAEPAATESKEEAAVAAQTEAVESDSVQAIIADAESRKESLIEPVGEGQLVQESAFETTPASANEAILTSEAEAISAPGNEAVLTPAAEAVLAAVVVQEQSAEKTELLPETFDIDAAALDYEVVVSSVIAEHTGGLFDLPCFTSLGQTITPVGLSAIYTSTAMSCLIFSTEYEVFTIPVNADGNVVARGYVEDYFSGSAFISRSYKPDADNLRADQKRSVQSTISAFNVPHKIKEIQIAGDVIYIKYENCPGVDAYRALFNEDGSIGGWSQSVGFARDKKVDFFYIGQQLPLVWYGYHDNGSCTFEQSMWELATPRTREFFAAVQQALPQSSYGVQAVHALSCNHLYETRHGIVATGYECAVYGSLDVVDSAIADVQAHVITIPNSGALVAAAVGANIEEKQEWLLLGGVGGLYAYAAADSAGFGLIDSMDNLFSQGNSWQKIGNLSFVKKIIRDKLSDDFVYVVAKGGLYKVSMNQKMFAEPKVEQLFNTMNIGSKFDYVSDCFIDGDFAILGTSQGLYAIDNLGNRDSIYKIDLDCSIGGVTQISACRGSQHFDNLYVLSNDQFKQKGRLHRLVVKNKKCTLFADCTQEEFSRRNVGVKGSFLEMETACSSFYSNGTWYIKINYPSYKREHEAIQCYQSGLRSGVDTVRTANRSLLRNMSLRSIDGAKNIAGMMHDPILGCWIVFGDFGLRILS
jgi:hypothetical protein